MEQEDFIVREISKIGQILSLIFNKIAGKETNKSLKLENHFEEAKGLLLQETGFDTELFLSLTEQETEQYLAGIAGFNVSNIESLAYILKVMGMHSPASGSSLYFEKALLLYELCNAKDKTFSFERANNIREINNLMLKL
jgi:hypothetical protein